MSDLKLINPKFNPYRQKLSLQNKKERSRSESSKIPKLKSKYSTYKTKLKLNRRNQKEIQTNNKIVINLTNCRYPVVEELAKDTFGWYVTRNDNLKWDIFWSDTVS